MATPIVVSCGCCIDANDKNEWELYECEECLTQKLIGREVLKRKKSLEDSMWKYKDGPNEIVIQTEISELQNLIDESTR